MTAVFVNRIATAVPPHDVHRKFVEYAPTLLADARAERLFHRMAERAQIDHRYSFVTPAPDADRLDADGVFPRGGFPDTARRMRLFQAQAPRLAAAGLDALAVDPAAEPISHLIVTTCTGLYAPGLDIEIARQLGLADDVERTVVGFMGCQAAMNALKLARHVVRAEPAARVLVVNLELCTLHLQETASLEDVLSFLIFGDGCAASLVSAEPVGLELAGFRTTLLDDSADLITWRIGGSGFDMHLSGAVPHAIRQGMASRSDAILEGRAAADIQLWAVHPGGRSVLDAVEEGLGLPADRMAASRAVLRRFGNMSSPSVMFVLKDLLATAPAGASGCALAFGPGLTAERLLFRIAAS